ADVNLATERVRLRVDPARAPLAALRDAVERAGYRLGEGERAEGEGRRLKPEGSDPRSGGRAAGEGVVPPLSVPSPSPFARSASPGSADADPHEVARAREAADLKRKFAVSLAAGLAMMALMYLPLPIQHRDLD